MKVRRVVTGLDEQGRSCVVQDGPAPRTHDFVHIPGFSNTVVWALADNSAPAASPQDITTALSSLMPSDGASALTIVQFPPVGTMETVDGAQAAEEQARELPGLAETFDPRRPGFHTTQTIDYQIVLSGELWLGLESGEETLVRQGDVVIQNRTSHAWTNRAQQPAILAAVSIGVRADN
ncbi:cupin domain-containing protein [Microbacterium timonense]|uniref:cupin domain-containing protein n=1 Tax=Microbacterium timonense TaxID=2086576 RepID=UPI000D0F5260|nr:cupin domain-containing protein [Microbacterium timonense]